MDIGGRNGEGKEQGVNSDKEVVDGALLRSEVEMDVDAQKTIPKPKHNHLRSKIEKKKVHRKARNSVVFPSITRKRKGPGMSKGKR
jgi:hypothetical protein